MPLIKKKETYLAKDIQILEGLEAVRKRPSMYIGDVGTRGLHHLIQEVIDNAIDEASAGYCDTITVVIHANNAISITDNGRGIPVDIHPIKKKSALELVFTVLHAGGKFDKKNYKISGGLHGVGLCCVCATSEYLRVRVYRGGKIYEQSYSCGKPLTAVEVKGNTNKRGTTIYFEADPTIFSSTPINYRYEYIADRLQELVYLNTQIKISLEDLRSDQHQKKVFFSEKGLVDFLYKIEKGKEQLLDKPIIYNEKKEDVAIDFAFTYNTSHKHTLYSYVNNIRTLEGGTHVTGFFRGLNKSLRKYGEKIGLLQSDKIKVPLISEDFKEGISGILSTKVMEPQFEGQTKTKLGNSHVAKIVSQLVVELLDNHWEEYPEQARDVISKIILAAQARQAARKAKEVITRKGVLSSIHLPGKLVDCREKNPSLSELFLLEGRGATGSAKLARNEKTQALYSMRGKITNSERASEYQLLSNEELSNILRVLGVRFTLQGEKVDLTGLRYHKIIVMTDADVDGSHIQTLLLTFFFRYLPGIIANGYLYIATPPLYFIKESAKKEHYAWSKQEKDLVVKKLEEEHKKNWTIQRFKGLGQMNPSQLSETTMSSATRKLKQVGSENIDSPEIDNIFSLLMGKDVASRRIFIEKNAYRAVDIDT